jgi:hypothetical protein
VVVVSWWLGLVDLGDLVDRWIRWEQVRRFRVCCVSEVMSFMLLLRRPFAKIDSMSIYSSKARRKSRE